MQYWSTLLLCCLWFFFLFLPTLVSRGSRVKLTSLITSRVVRVLNWAGKNIWNVIKNISWYHSSSTCSSFSLMASTALRERASTSRQPTTTTSLLSITVLLVHQGNCRYAQDTLLTSTEYNVNIYSPHSDQTATEWRIWRQQSGQRDGTKFYSVFRVYNFVS